MKQISCLIIEDNEIDARLLMNMLLEPLLLYQTDWASTATDALSRLGTQTYDLIFLDIEVPGLLGTDLLRDVSKRPPVIVTTAHVEYAEPCYDLAISDFLMKPFERSRLQRSISRALTGKLIPASSSPVTSIFLPANRRMQQFHFKDILFIEAYGAYVKVYTPQNVINVNASIFWLETQLPTTEFMRVQKSFIVNFHHITAVATQCVWVGEKKITVGIQYRAFLKQIWS